MRCRSSKPFSPVSAAGRPRRSLPVDSRPMSNVHFRKLPSGLTRTFMWLAWLTTAAALGVHLSSYGPDELGPFLINIALALFPVVFLIFGPVVVVGESSPSERR